MISVARTPGSMAPLRTDLRATWTLAAPLIGGHLAQQAIGVTDTVMLGWYGIDELAASGHAQMLYFLTFIFGSGFAHALMPLVAEASVQEDAQQVRRVTRMGLWLVCLVAILAMPFFWQAETLLLWLGQDPDLSLMAQDYLRIAGWGMVFSLMSVVLKNHLAALDHAQIALWSTLAAAGLNAVLNYGLIFGTFGLPELGLRGAAIATIGTNALMCAILALYAARVSGVAQYQIFARFWRPDWPIITRVARLGAPIGATSLAETGFFAASQVMIGWLGTLPLAAHVVALQITSITFMAHVGLSSAATIRAGRAWTRRDRAGLSRAAVAALALSAGFVALTVAAFLGAPEILTGLFLKPDEPDREAILAIGVVLLAMAALFQLADAAQVMALGLLRGLQDTAVPMLIALGSYWLIGVPAMYLWGFGLDWGPAGIWLGLVTGLIPAGIAFTLRFRGKVARMQQS